MDYRNLLAYLPREPQSGGYLQTNPQPELRRLVLGIGATLGIEAFVWLTDMGGLSREEATEVMRTNARSLLRCALERVESSEWRAAMTPAFCCRRSPPNSGFQYG
jgi:hypothetical protein